MNCGFKLSVNSLTFPSSQQVITTKSLKALFDGLDLRICGVQAAVFHLIRRNLFLFCRGDVRMIFYINTQKKIVFEVRKKNF